jgi:hypothetical protein
VANAEKIRAAEAPQLGQASLPFISAMGRANSKGPQASHPYS